MTPYKLTLLKILRLFEKYKKTLNFLFCFTGVNFFSKLASKMSKVCSQVSENIMEDIGSVEMLFMMPWSNF